MVQWPLVRGEWLKKATNKKAQRERCAALRGVTAAFKGLVLENLRRMLVRGVRERRLLVRLGYIRDIGFWECTLKFWSEIVL